MKDLLLKSESVSDAFKKLGKEYVKSYSKFFTLFGLSCYGIVLYAFVQSVAEGIIFG